MPLPKPPAHKASMLGTAEIESQARALEKERQQQQTLALAEDYPAVLPNELEQPQETTLPFFKFRADKQMDNARMKLPGHLY